MNGGRQAVAASAGPLRGAALRRSRVARYQPHVGTVGRVPRSGPGIRVYVSVRSIHFSTVRGGVYPASMSMRAKGSLDTEIVAPFSRLTNPSSIMWSAKDSSPSK